MHGVTIMTEHLNTEFLEEIKDVMEEEFALLLETYLRESELQHQRIDEAWQEQGLDELRRCAHSLKGSSGNIGAEQLAALCSQLERLARDKETEEVPETIAALSQEFAAVRVTVTGLYESHR